MFMYGDMRFDKSRYLWESGQRQNGKCPYWDGHRKPKVRRAVRLSYYVDRWEPKAKASASNSPRCPYGALRPAGMAIQGTARAATALQVIASSVARHRMISLALGFPRRANSGDALRSGVQCLR